MKIRKKFTFNNGHIVRNCSSERCKWSIHAHTYSIEFFFESNELDNGSMVIDFGLLKYNIKQLVQSFNNSFTIWNKDKDLINISKNFNRWIITPFSPSAEELSRFFLWMGKKIIQNTNFKNGEKNPQLIEVRVDETKSGYALASINDIKNIKYDLNDFKSNIPEFNRIIQKLKKVEPFEMPEVEKQIKV
jgi:6-pyruvoyltetrahydropterin/6-carboxytetrahydropterin synthase